jgi:signal-transduction protein with cAMP-binding, CBS, and nucleotidyltransferase domain
MKKRKLADNPNEQVGDYMSCPVLSIDLEQTVEEAAKVMHDKNVGSLLVKEGEDFVGIVTETDLTRKVLAQGLKNQEVPVKDVMMAPLLTIDCHEPLVEANQFMAKKHIRHLGVTENDQVVGMLSVRDLVHYYSNPRMRSW